MPQALHKPLPARPPNADALSRRHLLRCGLAGGLMNQVPWNPVSDLAPIVQVSGTTFGLLVPAGSPWKSLADMLAWARQHPGELLMGSTGVGTTAHLAMEEILLAHNISHVHVPDKGTPAPGS